MVKSRTVAEFERDRPHMCGWARDTVIPLIEETIQVIIVHAPVKSGKREIAEYIAVRDNGVDSKVVHLFISSWHRKSDDEQRKELVKHNLKVFSIISKNSVIECIKWIDVQIENGFSVICHVDECDYGSGESQLLSTAYNFIRVKDVIRILYSATDEEVLFSKEVSDEEQDIMDDLLYGVRVKYVPPPQFCGPKEFLAEGLVHEATPFYTLDPVPALTAQGRHIVSLLKDNVRRNNGRNIAQVRLTGKDGKRKEDTEIYKFLKHAHEIPELKDIIMWVDKGECIIPNDNEGRIRIKEIEWSNPIFWEEIATNKPIICLQQFKGSRSTEWKVHDRIAATHDFRKNPCYSIAAQAQQRPNHYIGERYPEFQRIEIYGHVATFKLAAGLITYEQYLNPEYYMKKIDIRRAGSLGEVYEIKNHHGHLHPQYQTPLKKDQAEKVLMELGCFGDVSISPRVTGSIGKEAIYGSRWFACTPNNFNQIIDIIKQTLGMFSDISFQNPFQNGRRPEPGEDGLELGYLRGWRVFDYDRDVKNQPGWGVSVGHPRLTICYHEGVLGVAIRWHTGNFKVINRLSAYRSMYPSK
jgi:hypothetical protein